LRAHTTNDNPEVAASRQVISLSQIYL